MLEIEAKVRVEDFAAVRSRLSELRASLIAQYHETNIFFDTPNRTLLSADSGLRLRRNHNLKTNQDQFILTFKGPQHPGQIKKREERELIVASDTNAIALLQSLGYEQTLKFEKHRDLWRLSQCEIALDDLPDLGKFVEIEGPNESAIETLRHQLGLANNPLIQKGYATLIAEKSA